jgi:hypothetical protein
MISAFSLPWTGAAFTSYLGLGSWLWFPSAAAALFLIRDGEKLAVERKIAAVFNTALIVGALAAFMLKTGVPGEVLSVEGLGMTASLENLLNAKSVCALVFFLTSAVLSFAPVRVSGSRVSDVLSFSYSAFLALVFFPPAFIFFRSLTPRAAIFIGAVLYFVEAALINGVIFGGFLAAAPQKWKYSSSLVPFAFTAAAAGLLFWSL